MRKILIVDDDESIRLIFKKVLENSGYEVQTASNGKVALNILENEKFDIFIIDLKMPEMDGITFLEEIKKRNYEGIPIILTAYGDKESAVSALKLGAYDFVEKPVSINDLKFAIQRAIERKELIEENARLKETEKINRIINKIFNFFNEEDFLKNFSKIIVEELSLESAMIYIYKPEEKIYFYPRFIPEIENFIEEIKNEGFVIKDVYIFQKVLPSEEIEGVFVIKSFFPFIEREIETFRLIAKQAEIFWKHLILKEKLKIFHLATIKTGRNSIIADITNALIKNLEEPLKNLEISFSYFKNLEEFKDLKETNEILRAISDINKIFQNIKEILGNFKPIRKKVKLGEIINFVYEILLPNFKESKISFWREGIPDVEIDGYPSLLEQIFINLFLNSIDSMKEGGKIIVRLNEEEDFVKIEISDTGSGIPDEIKDKIFEPFFTTKEGGLGIGLFLVKNAVKMHGGEIYFESEEGVGTTFYINLPKRWEGF
jgi:signal transduction histidine kinase/CheY-like chemotaxis protein